MSHVALLDARLLQLLIVADRELAEEARVAGCACGGTLHSARYPRKPRGGLPPQLKAEYGRRESLCCAREGCRKRTTPASLRFLGRHVYLGAVVVLASAMTGGVTAARARRMQALVGVSARTLQRWRAWWLRRFPQTAFWTGVRALLLPPVEEGQLPTSLLERFGDRFPEGLRRCLRFLAPLTTRTGSMMDT